jgi:hypothetical protein
VNRGGLGTSCGSRRLGNELWFRAAWERAADYGKIHCKWYLELATTLVQLAPITSIKLVVKNTILLDERGGDFTLSCRARAPYTSRASQNIRDVQI